MNLPTFQKHSVIAVLLLILPITYAEGSPSRPHLPESAIERVRQYKSLISDVETRPLQTIITELEKSDYPLLNLKIKEAMARTYVDIVNEEKITGTPKKRWLYSMVALNMACLQFGGTDSSTPLNKMILRKLKANLPADIQDQHGFHLSLE